MEELSFLSIFLMGISMSLSHCVGMCGGIVIAYSNGKIHKDASTFNQIISHLLYSLGRISSYAIIGGVSAFIGYGFSTSMHTRGILFVIVGVILILFAFLYVFFPKAITYLEPSISVHSKSYFSRFFRFCFNWFLTSKNLLSFYGLGMMNGFLPCGMVYYFALSAAMAPSVLLGMLSMGVFGVSTMFPMFALGFFSGKIVSSSFRGFFVKISFVLMLLFGGYSIYKGILMLQGKPMHSMHSMHSMGSMKSMDSMHEHRGHSKGME